MPQVMNTGILGSSPFVETEEWKKIKNKTATQAQSDLNQLNRPASQTDPARNVQLTTPRATGSYGGIGGAQAAVADPMAEILSLYQQQYDLRAKNRKRQLDATIKANNEAADKNLNEAYVRYMLQQKNLPQQLRAMGINGGATETTLGDMNNTYMNSRNSINAQRDNANLQAQLAYDNRVADAYNTLLANQTSRKLSAMNASASSSRSSGSGSRKSTTTKKDDDYTGGLGERADPRTISQMVASPTPQIYSNAGNAQRYIDAYNRRIDDSAYAKQVARQQQREDVYNNSIWKYAQRLRDQGYSEDDIVKALKRRGLVTG